MFFIVDFLLMATFSSWEDSARRNGTKAITKLSLWTVDPTWHQCARGGAHREPLQAEIEIS